jgi:hypothetical protein
VTIIEILRAKSERREISLSSSHPFPNNSAEMETGREGDQDAKKEGADERSISRNMNQLPAAAGMLQFDPLLFSAGLVSVSMSPVIVICPFLNVSSRVPDSKGPMPESDANLQKGRSRLRRAIHSSKSWAAL